MRSPSRAVAQIRVAHVLGDLLPNVCEAVPGNHDVFDGGAGSRLRYGDTFHSCTESGTGHRGARSS
jgi:hypothetical protein